MKTILARPKTYFILGVPRSGTTILCNLFNALEDSFCLNEPHWLWQTEGERFSKKWWNDVAATLGYNSSYRGWAVRGFNSLHWRAILPGLIYIELEYGSRHQGIGGYKETYRLRHLLSEELIISHISQVDFFLIVFRDPVLVHSSQRALGWKEWDRPEDFNESYRRLDELAQHEKGIPIVYEDFVKAPLEYLNKRLPFWIDGPLELKPTGHSFGDPFANRSTEIVQSQRAICLTDDEIKQHAPGREIWKKWREN